MWLAEKAVGCGYRTPSSERRQECRDSIGGFFHGVSNSGSQQLNSRMQACCGLHARTELGHWKRDDLICSLGLTTDLETVLFFADFTRNP